MDPKLLLLEQAASSERLKAVTGRGKGEQSLYPVRLEQPRNTAIRRRFWTPDELIEKPL